MMYSEKIKIRISDFVYSIIINDCQSFGFFKNDNSCNINSFLNKLIPSMLRLKKKRRNDIHEKLKSEIGKLIDVTQEDYLCSCVDSFIDNIYFMDIESQKLEKDVWVRPNQKNIAIFEEIAYSETEITNLELSVYIRQLLNEYAKLPQFKRENLCFWEELNLIWSSYKKSKVLNLRYGSEHYQVVVLDLIYGFIADQSNYIICYDIKNQRIASFYLFAMQDIRILEKKQIPPNDAFEASEKIIDNRLFVGEEYFEIKEVLNERQNEN